MVNPAQVQSQVMFALSQLPAQNAHHLFEHICRHLTTQFICSNVLPAPGRCLLGVTRVATSKRSARTCGTSSAQLSYGQNTWPSPGSSVGHERAVLLSATGQIPLAVDTWRTRPATCPR